MCFALLALQQHADYPFILLANRDEFFKREALPLAIWPDQPAIIGGRDLSSQGSWLAINQPLGRLALVTNVRQGLAPVTRQSRGILVNQALLNPHALDETVDKLTQQANDYSAFNLLVGHLPDQFYYVSNRPKAKSQRLDTGLYGLSNASLDSHWPKVARGKQHLKTLLQATRFDLDAAWRLLSDSERADDAELPDTGIGVDKERWLSSIFIPVTQSDYGTRCSTIILVNSEGRVAIHERTYAPDGSFQQYSHRFQLT